MPDPAKASCFGRQDTVQNPWILSSNKVKNMQQAQFLQIALVSLLERILRFLLVPLGETPTVTYLLAGFLMGQSGLAMNPDFRRIVLPKDATDPLKTLGMVGIMMYLFLLGVKMDLGIIKRSSRKAWVIGITTFIMPHFTTMPFAFISQNSLYHSKIKVETKKEMAPQFPIIAGLLCTTSFHAVSCFLAEHKILNTEIGRLATSISTISGITSWIIIIINFSTKQSIQGKKDRIPYFLSSVISFVIFITFFLRKYVFWIIKQTPNGESLKEIYLVSIFLMILGTGFLGEFIGMRAWFGPMVLGLAIPDGEPIGSAMTEKLETIISGFFLPVYCLYMGMYINVGGWKINLTSPSYVVLATSSLAFLGKFSGTIIPCLVYKIPLKEAFILALILCNPGIFDLTIYHESAIRKDISRESLTWLYIHVLITAATTSPVVRFLYKPSRKYIITKTRTIQNAKPNTKLCLLVCVYNEHNVPTIVNILDASNPTKESPISIYLLNIIELQGRSTPLLISHHQTRDKLLRKSTPTPSDHIINCFKIYEKQNRGVITLYAFTTITPFVSAHDDICTMALDNKTSLIIIPFHKQWGIDGIKESSKCRNVNQKVIDKAPCSVGISIDRGRLNQAKSVISCWSTYIVGIIFLGGDDDREALYYAMRMAEHPNIHLIVHRIIPVNDMIGDINDKILDDNLINGYRLDNVLSEHNKYKEAVVRDGFETVSVIRSVEDSYDLVLVGRRQDNYSHFLSELSDWNEYPELGFFGDMFASSDIKSNFPVLVVQQHKAKDI